MSDQLSRSEQLEQNRAYWKQHIEDWRSSGMTQADYCRRHELKDYRFTYWKKRFVPPDSDATFVPVKINGSLLAAPDPSSVSVRLIMDKDLAIEIRPDFDPRLLRRLIVTLRSLP